MHVDVKRSYFYHPDVDHFPIAASLKVFYSTYTIIISHFPMLNLMLIRLLIVITYVVVAMNSHSVFSLTFFTCLEVNKTKKKQHVILSRNQKQLATSLCLFLLEIN